MLAVAVLGSTLAYVDESVVNVALPAIETDLRTTLAAMQWVINAYTLCMSALLLVGGAAADRFGRRRVFVLGVSLFAVASLGCGLANGVAVLLAARAMAGIGAALLVPCSLALISAAFEERERGAAIGIWSGASAVAAGAAPLLGGGLLDHWSWRVIFLVNPLLAIPTLWISLRRVPESRDPDAPPGIDWPGSLLAFAGLGSLVYGLIASADLGWAHGVVVVSLALGAGLLTLFVVAESHSPAPMMPPELFRSPTFSGVNLLTLLLYGGLGGGFFFLPFLLIQARGYSATAAGAAYLPFTIILGGLSRWSGGLIDRFGARGPLILGPTIAAGGFALLAVSRQPYWTVLVPMVVLGLGMAVTVAPLTTAVLNAVPTHRTGVASGINNAVASVGSLLVIAVLGSVAVGAMSRSLERRLETPPAPLEVRRAVEAARGGFVIPELPASLPDEERRRARMIVAASIEETVRLTLWIAAALALAGALTAAATLPRPEPRATAPPPG
ncbi:MAG TPA: MFS transporter [Steroidobacteraceae bacterium]|nr:MFS transporter [Steroidobacteraceae bacterium]